MLKGKSFLYSEFARETKSFKKLAGHLHSEMTIGEVHDFRVLTRRLRAPLWLMDHCDESRKARRVQGKLRKLGRKLGQMRQLDVAIDDGRKYGSDTNPLQLKRALAIKGLHRRLKPVRIQRLVKHLESVARPLKKTHRKDVRSFLKTLEAKINKQHGHPPETKTGRHKLRIFAKKVRYLLEAMGHRSVPLEKLQDHLGRERDLSNFQNIFGKRKNIQQDELREVSEAKVSIGRAFHSALSNLRALRNELQTAKGAGQCRTLRKN